jgi:membrane dipeptidase
MCTNCAPLPSAGALATRRELLRGVAGLGLLALVGCASSDGLAVLEKDPATARLVDSTIAVDMHSHAAGVLNQPAPSYNLAAAMQRGRMTAVALNVVSDLPVLGRVSGRRVYTTRNPAPGELWNFTQRRLQWVDRMVADEKLRRVLKPGDLEAAHRDRAQCIVQAIEGCQFMEGNLERIELAYRLGVRQLVLVHFMRSDLGDIQTEPPTQEAMTQLGREVVAACNRLGIVVDVAHGTMAFTEEAIKASRTPVVLTHTSLAVGELQPYSRLISAEHGKLIANAGGVVGIWGYPAVYKSLNAFVDGIAHAVDVLGVDHVGIGTDISGFGPVASIWNDYGDFPVVVQIMRRHGFSDDEVRKVAGGNYLRVLNQTLRPAG